MNNQRDNWDNIRVAIAAAELGSFAKAGQKLALHHGTVARRVEALEESLGTKLFRRHARGLILTEAGEVFQKESFSLAEDVHRLSRFLRGYSSDVTGTLRITVVSELANYFAPTWVAFQAANPGITLEVLASSRRLEMLRGEADVALRFGPKPQEDDLIPIRLAKLSGGVYASKEYLERQGKPVTIRDLEDHKLVAYTKPSFRHPFEKWLQNEKLNLDFHYTSDSLGHIAEVVAAGGGVGFLEHWLALRFSNLEMLFEIEERWSAPLWLVTHVDQHRTPRVQTFVDYMKRINL